MNPSSVGSFTLRALIGDTIQAYLGWGKIYGQPLTVVVPKQGPFAYLKEIAECSPWVSHLLTLDIPAEEPGQESIARSVALLKAAGVKHLVVWDSEEWNWQDIEPLLRPHFDSVRYLPMLYAGLFAGVAQPWRIPQNVLAWRERFLAEHNIFQYITIHNRESAWARQLHQHGSMRATSWINDVRNYTLDPLIRACKLALVPPTQVIRVGDAQAKPCSDPFILDTTHMGLSLTQQFALHQGARFFVGCNSGVGNVAHAMRRPILYINTTQPFTALRFPDLPTINLGKRVAIKGQLVPYTQIDLYHGGFGPGRLVDGLDYELIENSVSELAQALKKMQALLDEGRNDDLYLSEDGEWLNEPQMTALLLGEKTRPKDLNLLKRLLAYQSILSRFVPRDFRTDRTGPFRLGIFGCGGAGKAQLHFFKSQRPNWTYRFYDNDPQKWGKAIEGIEVWPGHQLNRESIDFLIIATSLDEGSIGQQLVAKGWVQDRDFIYFQRAQDPLLGLMVEAHRLSPSDCRRARLDPIFTDLMSQEPQHPE
ncbi:MAG: TIGR04372 family glycosyltransferase [Acidobacteria bacterium]|nr:TIGR04372 family glycosyltransferase [Acidobacteriota bacterium]MCB9396334.1 TIGR04372 family glycosyltransferase [Acidobacteriota bacterium]